MDPRLDEAIKRGEAVMQQLAAAEGGSITTAQAARLLRVSQASVPRRWRAYRLVGWKQGRSLRVPVWQFDGRKVLKGVEPVLRMFRSNDQWRVMRYFLSSFSSLVGRRPLDLLREGKSAEVIAHAKAHIEENTW